MDDKYESARLIEILVVDDDPADLRFLVETFNEARLQNRITTMTDGKKALSCLRGEGEYAGSPKPDLVLLDINMPEPGGQAILAAIRGDPALSSLPVIMLTTSASPEDVNESYEHKADAYMVKPPDVGQLVKISACMDNIGQALVALPESKIKEEKEKAVGAWMN